MLNSSELSTGTFTESSRELINHCWFTPARVRSEPSMKIRLDEEQHSCDVNQTWCTYAYSTYSHWVSHAASYRPPEELTHKYNGPPRTVTLLQQLMHGKRSFEGYKLICNHLLWCFGFKQSFNFKSTTNILKNDITLKKSDHWIRAKMSILILNLMQK